MHRRWTLLPIVVAALFGSLAACDTSSPANDGPSGAQGAATELVGRLERLEVEPSGETVGYRTPRVFWAWSSDAPDVEASFRLESGSHRFVSKDDRQLLFLDRRESKIDMRVPLPLKAGGAWVLEVEAQSSIPGVEVWAGVIPRRGPPLVVNRELAMSSEPTVTEFRLGDFENATVPLVELRLGVDQGDSPVILTGLRLLQAPPDLEFGPGAFQRMALVNIGDDAARARALRANEPHFTYVQADHPDAVLRFQYGIPGAIDSRTEGRVLRVRAEGEGGTPPLTAELPLGTDSDLGWQQGELPLGSFAGQTVHVEFEYDAEGANQLLALGQPRYVVPQANPPTVVLMTSDTHRADHVGFRTSPERLRSPAIDQLAKRGVAFLDVTSSANNTTPSHVSLLTGLSPLATKLISNGTRLSDAAPTLAEVFAENGYTTLASVSALPLYHQFTNLGQGFDRFSNPREKNQRPGNDSLDDLLSAMGSYPDEPIFAWLHVYDAHAPYIPPEDMERLYYAADRDPYDPDAPGARFELAPKWNREIQDPEYTEALYRSEVTLVDGIVGRLLSVDRVQNGLFALTSDHGEVLSRGSDPTFGHKGVSWNTLAVPLIFAGGSLTADEPRADAVQQIDTARTLLNLAGLQHVEFPGRDLFAGDALAREPKVRFAMEANGLGASVAEGRFLLRIQLRLREEQPASEFHRIQLFDREADPFGEVDVSEEHSELTERLRQTLIDWLSGASDEDFSEATGGDSAEVSRQLAELGYATTGTMASATWIDPDCDCEHCRRFP